MDYIERDLQNVIKIVIKYTLSSIWVRVSGRICRYSCGNRWLWLALHTSEVRIEVIPIVKRFRNCETRLARLSASLWLSSCLHIEYTSLINCFSYLNHNQKRDSTQGRIINLQQKSPRIFLLNCYSKNWKCKHLTVQSVKGIVQTECVTFESFMTTVIPTSTNKPPVSPHVSEIKLSNKTDGLNCGA